MIADGHKMDFERKVLGLRKWLAARKAEGLLVTSTVNFSWLTHGRSYVNIADGQSVVKVLVTLEKVSFFTSSNETARLESEEIHGWGLLVVEYPWYESFNDFWEKQSEARRRILFDIDCEAELSEFRLDLTTYETDLLRDIGTRSVRVLEEFCQQLSPGISERRMAGELSAAAWSMGLDPLVLNMGTDDRALRFRHAIPTDKKLDRYALISVCFRRWGLHVTLTRSVYFGPIPADLLDRHSKVCRLESFAQIKSRPGTTLESIIGPLLENYAKEGFPDEWKKHPVGGGLGFRPREYDATPSMKRTLKPGQAFCWNPTIVGAKSEDTFLITDQGPESITSGNSFPTVSINLEGRTLLRPGILER